jgi:Protein of unknown function (DUF2958)
LGYIDLHEVSRLRGRFHLPIERDVYFKPTKLSDIRRHHEEQRA